MRRMSRFIVRSVVAAIAATLWLPAGLAVVPVASSGYAPLLVVKFHPAGNPEAQAADRVARLAADSGITLVHVRTMAIGAQVLRSPAIRSEQDADAIAAELARHPGVAYAERSRRVQADRVPNDPSYRSQFYLLPGPTTIDAQSAWDLTTGSPAVVVAVLDSGSTRHADLAGRLLAGYDFVADFVLSNDGSATDAAGTYRDADPSDPGDWVSAADLAGPLADSPCTTPRDSSWHGTAVMGMIAANADNGRYLTGVDWNARILPVRVLGKCYGEDVDVADGIAWAAGVAVPDAPANPHPAQVINLSLSMSSACQQFMREAIDAAFARGVTRAVVASAGNNASNRDHSPSSCPGVLSIGASTFNGNRAWYSNFGARVDLMAPGGDGTAGTPYDLLTLHNTGTTVPEDDTTLASHGTSFSSAQVSGVVALMLAVAPDLGAADVRALLKSSAKPFPADSACSASTCGAGILDAAGAVRAALAAPDLNQHGLTGSWYEPATSGQGVELEVYPDHTALGTGLAFLSWFTYDSVVGGADRQRWYVADGPMVTGQPSATLTIYRNTGGNFNAPPVTDSVVVGTATLGFDSCTSGMLSYRFTDGTGRIGSIPLNRLTQSMTCSITGARPTNADFAFSGNWYDPATSGQGVTVEVNTGSQVLFLAWYTYAPNGAGAGPAGQRWYTAEQTVPLLPATRTIPLRFFETTGGAFDAPTSPAPKTVVVGSGTLAFESCTSATLSYSFTAGSSSGASGAIALRRVGPAPAGCAM